MTPWLIVLGTEEEGYAGLIRQVLREASRLGLEECA